MQMESLGDQISRIGDFDHNISIMYSREIRVSKSQWGSLSQAMAKKDIKIQKLVRMMSIIMMYGSTWEQ